MAKFLFFELGFWHYVCSRVESMCSPPLAGISVSLLLLNIWVLTFSRVHNGKIRALLLTKQNAVPPTYVILSLQNEESCPFPLTFSRAPNGREQELRARFFTMFLSDRIKEIIPFP